MQPSARLLAVLLALCAVWWIGNGTGALEQSDTTEGSEPGTISATLERAADSTDAGQSQPGTASQERGTRARAIRVIDGDTLTVHTAAGTSTVRLIGIDAPETGAGYGTRECFSAQATEKLRELVAQREVHLQADPTQQNRDRYGRLLRYILVDGTNINREMVRRGYAHEYTYRIPYQEQASFRRAERKAREHDRGLFAPGTCSGNTDAPADKQPNIGTFRSDMQQPSNHTCSYNAYDCSDFSSHEQAQRTFRWCGGTAADVHWLDGDGDGIACEALKE
jgi:micrococcal nuclease